MDVGKSTGEKITAFPNRETVLAINFCTEGISEQKLLELLFGEAFL
jgi:hypothetical protein